MSGLSELVAAFQHDALHDASSQELDDSSTSSTTTVSDEENFPPLNNNSPAIIVEPDEPHNMDNLANYGPTLHEHEQHIRAVSKKVDHLVPIGSMPT